MILQCQTGNRAFFRIGTVAVRIFRLQTLNAITGTGFEITPVLGMIPPDLPLRANPAEVESWFEVPLATVLDPAKYDEQSALWRGAERRYYELHHEGYRIWGVTAAILLNLSRRLQLTELFDG